MSIPYLTNLSNNAKKKLGVAAMVLFFSFAFIVAPLPNFDNGPHMSIAPEKANALPPIFDYFAGINVFPFPCLCSFSYLIPVYSFPRFAKSGIFVFIPFASSLYSYYDIFSPGLVKGSAVPGAKVPCMIWVIIACIRVPGELIWQIGTSE